MAADQTQKSGTSFALVPIMLGFFAMGFADIVGTIMNQVTGECNLSPQVAGFLPSMIFIWFLVISVPAGVMSGRLGRRNTCLLSLALTAASMFLGLAAGPGSRVWIYYAVFALLGIGNTILQAALPALLSNVTAPEQLTSRISFGQFVKAICAALTPVFVWAASVKLGNWKLLFPIYGILTVIALVSLVAVPIPREAKRGGQGASFLGALSLLGDGRILLLALGVFAAVAADVGFNIGVPDILKTRYEVEANKAGMGPTVFFIAKTLGTFVGAFVFARVKPVRCFPWCVGTAAVGLAVAFCAMSPELTTCFLIAVFVASFGLANVFGICFGLALARQPERTDEASALMVMMVAGGAVVAPALGFARAAWMIDGIFAVLVVPVAYLIVLAIVSKFKFKG